MLKPRQWLARVNVLDVWAYCIITMMAIAVVCRALGGDIVLAWPFDGM